MSKTGRVLKTEWTVVLGLIALLVQLYSIYRVVPPITETSRPYLLDSIIFEYGGWSLATGTRLYSEFWAIKPPLAFEMPALLSLLAGENMLYYHLLAIGVTNLAAIASVLLIGAIVFELTNNGLASIAAGISIYVVPAFHWRAAFGFKAKYFVIAFGLFGIYMMLRDRPTLAGIAAAATVGMWQIALIVPAVVLGLASRGGKSDIIRTSIGMILGGVIILAPVVFLWDSTMAMITETILHPFLGPEGRSPLDRIRYALLLLGPAIPVVIVGVFGFYVARKDQIVQLLGITALWFGIAIVFWDLDNFPDLFPLCAVLAVGVGLAAARSRITERHILVGILVLASINVATMGAVIVGLDPVPIGDSYELKDPGIERIDRPVHNESQRQAIFWYGVPTDTCRPFLGGSQLKIIEATNQSPAAEWCGQFGPAWRAMMAKIR